MPKLLKINDFRHFMALISDRFGQMSRRIPSLAFRQARSYKQLIAWNKSSYSLMKIMIIAIWDFNALSVFVNRHSM